MSQRVASTKSESGSVPNPQSTSTDEAKEFLGSLELELAKLDRDLSTLTAEQQLALLKQRAVHVVKEDLLKQRLAESKQHGKPLRVKYGIDPTSPDAHLGHAVPVILARRLLQMGHHVIILFGDFTALVGDPSGRVKTRPVLTADEVQQNVASYREQVGKFIDMSKVEIAYNSPFFNELSILELLNFYRRNKISPILQREDFRNRAEGLTIAEALYPTLMAIDSIKLTADIELGGNDQLLNFHTAVAFMESVGMVPQSSLTTELLQGTSGDGKKMSKSEGNYIALTEPADQAFGKVMSIPDTLLEHYFKLVTDITDKDWARLARDMASGVLNPVEVKKMLARLIVGLLHSRDAALREQQAFEKLFSRHALPDDMPEFAIVRSADLTTITDLVLLCEFASTRSEVRRLAQSGAISIIVDDNTARCEDPYAELPDDKTWVLKVGKRRFARIRWQDKEAVQSSEVSDSAQDTATDLQQTDDARTKLLEWLAKIPLIEHESCRAGIHPKFFEANLHESALYYGTGLCTSKAMSVGLPFDVLGMLSLAETARRHLGFNRIIQLIADTHARSNAFTTDAEVDAMAQHVRNTMRQVAKSLDIEKVFTPVVSSEFDTLDEYRSILTGIKSEDHEYVRREWSDIEYLRRHYGLALKLSWTIGPNVKKVGFDERLYDRRFSEVMGKPMSFLYLQAGRTLDKSRPKASPYIAVPGEHRIMLKRDEDVSGKLAEAQEAFGDAFVNGVREHLTNIVDLFESLFSESPDNASPLEERIERILNRVCT